MLERHRLMVSSVTVMALPPMSSGLHIPNTGKATIAAEVIPAIFKKSRRVDKLVFDFILIDF